MRKKIPLFLLLVLLQTASTLAQSGAIDSLNQLLLAEKEDSSRSLLLSRLSIEYMTSNPDTALLLAQEGLALAKQINFINGEAMGLNQTANVFNITGNYPRALTLFLEALRKGNYFPLEDEINIPVMHCNHLILSKLTTGKIRDEADIEEF